MKKSIQFLTTSLFSLSCLVSPFLVPGAAQAQTVDQSNTVSASSFGSYQMNILSNGTTTVWQKTFPQTITYSESADLQQLVFNTLKAMKAPLPSAVGLGVYLVPAGTIAEATKKGAFYVFTKSGAAQALKSVDLPTSPGLLANGATPSAFLYPSDIASSTKWGYYVGYMPAIEGQAVGANMAITGNSLTVASSSTHYVPNFNFSWIPTGTYYVYLVQGVASYTDITGNSQSIAFPIEPPFGAYSKMEKLAKEEVGAIPPVSDDWTNPGYNRELFPLPTSATRTIKFKDAFGNAGFTTTETDSVIGAVSGPITVTPAPALGVTITSPSALTGDDQWHKNEIHYVKWLANFQRSHISNTGVESYADISIGKPYGYSYNFLKPVTQSIASSIAQTLVSTFGNNYRTVNLITSVLKDASSSDDVVRNAVIGNVNTSLPSAPVDATVLRDLSYSPILKTPLSILEAFGVFDAPMPYKVSVYFEAIPYNPIAGTYEKKKYLLRPYQATDLAKLDQYLEAGKAMVEVNSLPEGTYVIKMGANWGAKTTVFATSSPFTVLPRKALGSDITSMKFSAAGSGITATITGKDFTQNGNTLVIERVNGAHVKLETVASVPNLSADWKFSVLGQRNTIITPIPGLMTGEIYAFRISNAYGTSSPFFIAFQREGLGTTYTDGSGTGTGVATTTTTTGTGTGTTQQGSGSTSTTTRTVGGITFPIVRPTPQNPVTVTTVTCPAGYIKMGDQTCKKIEVTVVSTSTTSTTATSTGVVGAVKNFFSNLFGR